ncbi:acyl-CoA dehydrogenase family protein [Bacillus solitudinis]|uniref:acyl-CoA dehydrogenase family protein n=1 Tax=Bacillus solitudinis TaxID=2014074 RepID=UPI000C250E39|nr:acyl-CoA dehydrogenase family protein [Bacillus solitudinis]
MTLLSEESFESRINIVKQCTKPFFDRAWEHDKEGSFPKENIDDLRKIQYQALTVPKIYGGLEISLFELVQLQETIAEADGATSLSIGWHIGIIKNLFENPSWEEHKFADLCKRVVEGSLINAAVTEPETGSPTRGGKPVTSAKKNKNSWIINGRKTFTTMAPVLDFFIVSAAIEGSEMVANFLISKNAQGLSINNTWNMMSMRATGSHDLILENVTVAEDDLVEYITPGDKPAAGWLLHIPACYLGIARAAKTYAVNYAKSYSPNSIEGTISELPNVRQKIGEIELLLHQSSYFLYGVAKKWDGASENERNQMKPELAAVKNCVTNQAIEVVDLAMRIVGAKSLSLEHPLQRYYRDVRAGLHNPPMDDMTIMLLAQHVLSKS